MIRYRLIPEKIVRWDLKKKCGKCGVKYMECKEIGQLNCFYHPGNYINDEKWSCCNSKSFFEEGCSRKDHMENETEWYVFDKLEIDLLFNEVKEIDKFHEEAVLKLHKDQYICIKRNLNVDSEKIKDKFDTFLKYENKINQV
jgi:hypothetical protein